MTLSRDKSAVRARWYDLAFVGTLDSVIQRVLQGNAEFSDLDLAGISIGVSGPVKELCGANLRGSKFASVDLSFCELSCSLNEVMFNRVVLTGARLDRCLVRKALLGSCDFAQSRLVVNCDDSVFEYCNFSGATFGGGSPGSEYGGRRATFAGCNFSGAIFKGVEFRATRFVDCDFSNVRFSRVDLRGAKATGGILPAADQFQAMDAPPWAV